MGKLQDLIHELCPDGVEYKELGKIAKIVRGASPRPIQKFITDDADGVPWIKIGDVSPENKYVISTKEKITKEGANKSRLVKKGDFILSNSMSFGRPYIMKINGCIHDGWLSISNFEHHVTSDYLYYVLSSSAIQREMSKKASFGGAVQNLNADIVRGIAVPVPPLPVQAEIVRILDTFTALIDNLQTEKGLRKKQYEYYREKLLSFDGSVKQEMLGEMIVSLNTGLNPRRFFKLNADNANNYYVTIRELQNNKIVFSEKTDRINDEALKLCNNRSNLEAGDVLFSGTGTIGVTALIKRTPQNWNIKEGIYAIKPKQDIINSKFLMYLLNSEDIRKAFLKKAAGGTVKSVPIAELKGVSIPVPPLAEQQRIVNTLDKFTALMENIDKEIELRQKQYEYYRDKLLSFKINKSISEIEGDNP